MPPDRGLLGSQGRYRSQCGSTSRVQEVAGKEVPLRVVEAEWKEVQYSKTWEVSSDRSLDELWRPKFYCKPVEFAEEKEWRLCISLRHSFPILNETLILNFGNLQGMFSYEEFRTPSVQVLGVP